MTAFMVPIEIPAHARVEPVPERVKVPRGGVAPLLERVIHGDVGSDCVIWPFAVNSGYPIFNDRGKTRYARVVVCEAVHGPRPSPNHVARSSCDLPRCINRDHLRWDEPAKSGPKLGSARKRVPETPMVVDLLVGTRLLERQLRRSRRVSRSETIEVRQLAADGATVDDLAEEFEVSRAEIRRVLG